MRKKMLSLLLCSMLCLCAAVSLADYGTAVVDARNSTRINLREQATTESNSLGLFFTGTEVECVTDPDADWVHVRIGNYYGYMSGRYLKTGKEAEYVRPYTWTGYTTASNYARLRSGPSTEYQFLAEVRPGDRITIMGETSEKWYYAEVNGEYGYISRNLVRVYDEDDDWTPSYSQPTYATPEPVYPPYNEYGWRNAYIAYIRGREANASEHYTLTYMDEDNIPELVIDSGWGSGIMRVMTYRSGQVVEYALTRGREDMLNMLYGQ